MPHLLRLTSATFFLFVFGDVGVYIGEKIAQNINTSMRSAAGVAKVGFFVKIVSVGLQKSLKYQCVANEQKPLSFEKKMMFFLWIIFFSIIM